MKINPWVECPNCKKVHNISVTGTTFRCSCGQLNGGEEIKQEPLETMPSWAQDIVCDMALGFLEHNDATWEWYRGSDNYILIRLKTFKYMVSRTGIR